MPEAWVLRESQRQELIRSLIDKIYDEEDRDRERKPNEINDFFSKITIFVVDLLTHSDKVPHLLQSGFESWFRIEIYEPVRIFSRSDIEKNAIFAQLLEKHLISSIIGRHISELQRETMDDPEKILLAKSAMEEVPYPEGE
jgi:hypothetical protein